MIAASNVLWLTVPDYPGLIAFAAVLGIAYGIRIALVPSVLIAFFGIRDLGVILGTFFTATGLASLLGSAVAGWIMDSSAGYAWGIAYAGAMGALGFAVIALLRVPPEMGRTDLRDCCRRVR